MTVLLPDIDPRRRDDIIRHARRLAAFYTPEWRPDLDGDAGAALLGATAQMLEGLSRRLNRAPQKHFVEFLNLLGVELVAPRPARAPLKFQLSQGAQEAVDIPARFQVLGQPEEGDPLVFETETPIGATPARLQALLSVRPAEDAVFDHGAALEESETELFGGSRNVQEHVLYLGDDSLLDVTAGGDIKLKLEGRHLNLLTDTRLVWEWSSGQGEWTAFEEAAMRGDVLTLSKDDGEIVAQPLPRPRRDQAPLQGEAEEEIKTRWIRLRLREALKPEDPLLELRLGGLRLAPQLAVLDPQAAFVNDLPVLLPVSEKSKLRPFGLRPRQGDIFYLGSDEVFSKPAARVSVKIESEGKPTPKEVRLSWEYWNGAAWRPFDPEDGTGHFSQSGQVTFIVPEDLQAVEAGGVESRWVRIRLAEGDYGQEIFKGGQPPDLKNVHEPVFRALRLETQVEARPPQNTWTFNNLLPRQQKDAASPFARMEDVSPALYMGFERAPEGGPISLFAWLREQFYPRSRHPKLEWQYLRREEQGPARWTPLEVADDTRSLTETGVIRFVGPTDFAVQDLLGYQGLTWIRAVEPEALYRPVGRRLAGEVLKVSGPEYPVEQIALAIRRRDLHAFQSFTGDENLPGQDDHNPLTVLHEKFEAMLQGGAPAPLLRGLFLNTSWAEQSETVTGETVGSSDGTEGQTFFLARTPVISETLWVDELDTLSEDERESLLESDAVRAREERDDEDLLVRFWAGWRRVEDLLDASGGDDRVYLIDRTSGEIRFGDGRLGRIPPPGRSNIEADYRAGGGSAGNLARESIATPRTSLPFIEQVVNPLPAEGGSDAESPQRALGRGPQRIRHRDRAVACDDFQWLAMEASARVGRAKCLPNRGESGRHEPGSVLVIIVPAGRGRRPRPSLPLKNKVRSYLRMRAANVAAAGQGRIEVIGPTYFEVRLEARIVPVGIDAAGAAESKALQRVRNYLHPLKGGPQGRGWEFGRLPCRSEFFSLLEAIPETDHVEDLRILVSPEGSPSETRERRAGTEEGLTIPSHGLIVSGRHLIRATPSRRSG